MGLIFEEINAKTSGILYAASASADAGKISWGEMELLRMSETKPGNVLPKYFFMQGSEEGGEGGVRIGGGRGDPIPFTPDDSCDDDIFEGANPDLRSPQLPHLSQDDWGCERKPAKVPILVYENSYLRASIAPQWGGKIWALYDKVNKREMLYNNEAHQPANIGALKAWTAGGCEWNWSPGIIGHSAFSESPVFAAEIDTELGPALRVYEFDRYNNTVWQVDMVLKGPTLWVHPKVSNPTENDVRGYWWTCVAHTITGDSRVVTPATSAVQTSIPTNEAVTVAKSAWPVFATFIKNESFCGVRPSSSPYSYKGADNSYYGNIPGHVDIFVRIPKPRTPYIAHSSPDGYSIVHGHELNGTKFFTWGTNPMANFWMDFLAGGKPGGGDYAELQVGPAPTQMQTFSLPKGSQKEWTEFFRGFTGNKAKLMDDNDYSEATGEIERHLPSSQETESMHAALSKISAIPVKQHNIIHNGSSWGALHMALVAKQGGDVGFADAEAFEISGLLFPFVGRDEREVRPWRELLSGGAFSKRSLSASPLSFMTRREWAELLSASKNVTWLRALHLGVHFAERGDTEKAMQLFSESIRLSPSAQAYRSLAVLSSDSSYATGNYTLAWRLAKGAAFEGADRLRSALASEIARFLNGRAASAGTPAEQKEWLERIHNLLLDVKSAPNAGEILANDNVLAAQTRARVQLSGELDAAIATLSSQCFPTYGSERAELIELWYDAHYRKAVMEEKAAGSSVDELSPVEKHRIRRNNAIPANIGCPYPDNTWNETVNTSVDASVSWGH
eukprot:jgi/Bigna1/88639/estExt_fgenesh1_pg.C_350101